MTEAQLLAEVSGEATANGWLWHHCPDSRTCGGEAGFPDLIMVRRGELLAVELKTNSGQLSPGQRRWLRELPLEQGHLCRPRDLTWIRQRLEWVPL